MWQFVKTGQGQDTEVDKCSGPSPRSYGEVCLCQFVKIGHGQGNESEKNPGRSPRSYGEVCLCQLVNPCQVMLRAPN